MPPASITLLIAGAILALLPLGLALAWAARALALYRRGYTWGLTIMSLTGWAILCLALLAISASMLTATVFAALFVMGMIGLIVWGWKRRGDRLQVLWALGSAARSGLPFSPAVRCLAHERQGVLGIRLTRFADLLDQGVAVPQAAAQTIRRTTFDGDVALHVHWHLNAMPELLQDYDPESDETEKAMMKLSELAFYFLMMTGVFLAVCAFLAMRVVPAFAFMMPSAPMPEWTALFAFWTRWLRGANMALVQIVILVPLLMTLTAFATVVFLRHLQMLPRDLPLLSRLALPLDRARLLDALSLVVRKNQPLQEGLRFLSEHYPKSLWRRRMKRAAEELCGGAEWVACLWKAKVVTSSELGLLRAADRAGNAGWALRELSGAVRRRYLYRLQWRNQIAAPAIVVLWGVVVAVLCMIVLLPMAQIIVVYTT